MQRQKFRFIFSAAVFAIALTAIIAGCSSDKTVDFYSGKWSAADITVGDTYIGGLDIVIGESDTSSERTISSNGKSYDVDVFLEGVEADNLGATYYRKKLRLAFDWGQKEWTINAVIKEKGDTSYLEVTVTAINPTAALSSQQSDSIEIVMYAA